MLAPNDITPPDPISQGINDLGRRLRILEERYTTLRRKGQLNDENLLKTEEDVRTTIKKLNSEINELRKLLIDIDSKLDRFLIQAKNSAKREEVLILRKYLEMWDPLKYLTREEAERLLNQQLLKK